jgi:EAL domain-containing protein (putative c-di-GMP-specific phosphodiesterase class I)
LSLRKIAQLLEFVYCPAHARSGRIRTDSSLTKDDRRIRGTLLYGVSHWRCGLAAPQRDRWVISTAFLQYEKSNLPHRMSCICTINLSGASVCDDNFYDFLLEQFSLYKIPPRGICLEITETSAIANLPQARVLIRKLKDLGCRFALDDFGSGMSSFTYLKHLPVDYSKIDGGFVKDMVQDPIDRAMVEAINHIGHVMQIKTIAECVENGAILEALPDIGVNFPQGYGIERPSLSVLSTN